VFSWVSLGLAFSQFPETSAESHASPSRGVCLEDSHHLRSAMQTLKTSGWPAAEIEFAEERQE
jgi:hypothetical protein